MNIMEEVRRVSFDFDETLDRKDVQEFAKELIQEGIDVYICTSRYSDQMAPRAWFPEFKSARACGYKDHPSFRKRGRDWTAEE